jgi:hypothetical protein
MKRSTRFGKESKVVLVNEVRQVKQASRLAKLLTCQKIIVIISEKKPKKNWFSIGEEEVPWEQWCVCLFFLPQRAQ